MAANNVVYIEDPNSVNINNNLINAVPQYQDMHIFAELTAFSRGRTILMKNTGAAYSIDNASTRNVKINLMGNNQNKNENNPNYLNFTTNYYDGSTGNEMQYEGFGITNIKTSINSSYVPQVSIQFVDIRGLSFFNQKNSPYRVLFDFPPPIFTLTIKGYYGKALEYKLHLVKYTTEFKADNGNFYIDAQFVAMTFAPLTDVLFRYSINFAYVNVNETVNASPSPTTKAQNTDELILKLENLYIEINKIRAGQEGIAYNKSITDITQNSVAIQVLRGFIGNLSGAGIPEPYAFTIEPYGYNASNPPIAGSNYNIDSTINMLNDVADYEDTMMGFGTKALPSNIFPRLLIGFIVSKNYVPSSLIPNTDGLSTALLNFRTKLIGASTVVTMSNTDISEKPFFLDNHRSLESGSIDVNQTIKYIAIDVTNYYFKLYNKAIDLTRDKSNYSTSINDKINTTTLKELGMRPTIYNIFKILLDDVDVFFKKLRKVSFDAENHHKLYESKILGKLLGDSGTNSGEKIYAFPLVVENQQVTGGFRETRIAPYKLSQSMVEFPEMSLVHSFIESFPKQKFTTVLNNMKAHQNDDGTFVWIPFSPFDSVLGLSGNNNSPYIDVNPKDGAGNINISSDPRLVQVLKIVLNRFYNISQATTYDKFYGKNTNVAYANYFSESESANLAESITQSVFGDMIKTNALKFAGNIKLFYDELENNIYNEDYKFLSGSTKIIKKEINGLYTNKGSVGYKGLVINTDSKISTQDRTISSTGENGNKDIVATLINDIKKTGGFFSRLLKGIFGMRIPEDLFLFTNENVVYIADAVIKNGKVTSSTTTNFENINLATKFIGNTSSIRVVDGTDNVNIYISRDDSKKHSKEYAINILLNKGNLGFADIGGSKTSEVNYNNVIDVWASQLGIADDLLFSNPLITTNTPLSRILYLSNFGFTLSPYNYFPNNLNELIFQYPAVIQMPAYLPAYIGALVDADKIGDDGKILLDELKEFFTVGSGKYLDSSGLLIFADIYDINTYLSANDKAACVAQYEFFKSNFDNIITSIGALYAAAKVITPTGARTNAYQTLLDPTSKNGGTYFRDVLRPFFVLNSSSFEPNMVTFSETTFRYSKESKATYESLFDMNNDINDTTKKTINNNFFRGFFQKLNEQIAKKNKENEDQVNATKRLSYDEDIINQTYYSFKNINDKWLCNPDSTVTTGDGYPFNRKGKNLIDSFAFVDRAMNPIGDTIINVESLPDMSQDTNMSIFTVLSRILSENNFLFFPLQNFMNYVNEKDGNKIENWNNSFKIDVNGTAPQSTAFICMYVGGSSTYPSDVGNGFKDDCINDIATTNSLDFNTVLPSKGDLNIEDDNQINKTGFNFYSTIRAFKVRFGEQNQSMFTDIKIDSKEYPETNESLKILSKLAGDGKTSGVPKGQNLYNVYENRAYKATITSLGNAMIQPTQYFQLDNVPLFNGAYLILSVDHTIEPNKMTTTFSGTKILKYPVPRVLSSASIFGFDDVSSDDKKRIQDSEINSGSRETNPSVGKVIPPTNQFYSPIDPQKVNSISSKYGDPRPIPTDENRKHAGYDFTARGGTPIWAVKDGKIYEKNVDGGEDGGYGNYITIYHDDDTYSIYGHLLGFAPFIEKGSLIMAGALVGWCGSTGHSTGAHLHFEYREKKNLRKNAVDSKPFLLDSMKSVWDTYDKP